MNVWITGEKQRLEELQERLPNLVFSEGVPAANEAADLFIDLSFDDRAPEANLLQSYTALDVPVVLSTVKRSLAESFAGVEKGKARFFGMNALPSFINRPAWELSACSKDEQRELETILEGLEIKGNWVEDRVGLLSPRVLFMIINEACYTVQEGTASYSDIDQAMKLGTNYPKGPFEWANVVGVQNVYESLEAMYQDTRDERYRISPLLKQQYLANKPFELGA